MIIKPKKYAGLTMALIIEFFMVLFYINATSLKMLFIEFGISLIVIIIFCTEKTIILDEQGCCLSWFNGLIKKKYKWEAFKTKRILYKMDQKVSYGFESEKCVLLAMRAIKEKSVWNHPFVQSEVYTATEKGVEFVDNFSFLFKPINIIYIYFNSETGKCEKDGSYCELVDEEVFMEKMAEWHVELEDNKPEEIPPWKEQL